MQGGPALHGPDQHLLQAGYLHLDDLITVRRGELALQPLAREAEPVAKEFLKLRGKNGSWCCVFYDEATRGCSRYAHRPMACGLLDCTDTAPLLAIAGKDLLTRFDCIASHDPMLSLVHEYEALCPCPDLQSIRQRLRSGALPADRLGELEAAVIRDLGFRGRITAEFGLSVDWELFYFGRPIFQLLQPLGLQAVNGPAGIRLMSIRR
jgi:hypothetical protein